MCALRAIPLPDREVEEHKRRMDPAQSAIVGANDDIVALRILPHPEAQTRQLAIIQFATQPGGLSAVHHHGDLDTGVYVIKGTIGFKCGAGMRDYVAMREGELGLISPQAVHQENNPDAAGWSLGLSIRIRSESVYFPCEAPAELPGGKLGLHTVPRPAVTKPAAPPADDDALGALSTHHLRTPDMALDRIELAPGARFTAPHATRGETAISALSGAVRLSDTAAGTSLQGKDGAWWYLDGGTRWSVENTSPDTPAEVLLVRSQPQAKQARA
jgi:uncharacterized RmlC-like cupin family protein